MEKQKMERMVDYMKVIEQAVMPNGTEIQLEDWRENNTREYPDLTDNTLFFWFRHCDIRHSH